MKNETITEKPMARLYPMHQVGLKSANGRIILILTYCFLLRTNRV